MSDMGSECGFNLGRDYIEVMTGSNSDGYESI